MKKNNLTKPTGDHEAHRRPPFNKFDWIIAVFSIALLAVILLNLPAY